MPGCDRLVNERVSLLFDEARQAKWIFWYRFRMEMGRKAQSGRCLGAGRVCNRHVYPHSNGGEVGGGSKTKNRSLKQLICSPKL